LLSKLKVIKIMLIVGIAGGTGSGKTTVVRKITEKLPEGVAAVIPQDSYYRDNSHLPLEERQEMNFDHPDSVEFELLAKHIRILKSGKPVEQPIYSYLTCTRAEETIPVEPKSIIIIEGILILGNEELRNLMDIKVYVDADADDRLSRVISRDIIERGRSVDKVLERYEKTVKPSHLQFIEPSKRYADIIVPQGGNNIVAINILTSTIEKSLEKDSRN
jgi:uridine kinase